MVVAQRKVQYEEQQHSLPVYKKQERPKAEKKSKIKTAHKLQIIFSIMALVGLCVAVIFGYAQLTEAKYRMYYLDREAKELEGQIENLKVELESIKKTDMIEKQAKDILGMQYPQKDQIVYLDLSDEPVLSGEEQGIQSVKEHDNYYFSVLKDMFSKIYAEID
ncbi:MAG: cell division protein FtsL [Thermotaleaceae bacterium]